MKVSRFQPSRWFADLAVFSTLLTLGGVAKAESVDPGQSAEPAAPTATKVEPNTASSGNTASTGDEAPVAQAQVPFLEAMGPETYPGSSRGLYGGSLWLEPTFHGLQWPRNTRTGLGVSGNIWVDSGYETIKRPDMEKLRLPNSSMYFQQGRGVVRLTPAYVHGRFFFQGQAELVGNFCQSANAVNNVCAGDSFSTDDLWIRVGEWNRWDLKVGRFQGWEVYHLGMGMDPYTFGRSGAGMFGVDNPSNPIVPSGLDAPSLYGVNYLRDRPTDGRAVGYAALHLYPTDSLRFEVLVKMGTDNNQQGWKDTGGGSIVAASGYTYYGARPTAIFDLGWLKFKVAGEYQKRKPVYQDLGTVSPSTDIVKKAPVADLTNKGIGASLQFVFDPTIEFGFNAAIGKQDSINDKAFVETDKTYTTKSFGLFANFRVATPLLVGVGANWTEQLDAYLASGSNVNNYVSHLQGFVSLQYLLATRLFLKAELSYAQAHFQPSELNALPWNNSMFNGHVRLMYYY